MIWLYGWGPPQPARDRRGATRLLEGLDLIGALRCDGLTAPACLMDQSTAKSFIARPPYAAHPLLPGRQRFFWRQTDPGGEMALRFKRRWINLDRQRQRMQ
jgi:hypothetical protein